MATIFNVPNEDKNVRLIEKKTGILMIYTLACPKEFNNISFRSRGKCYYSQGLFIPYQNDMSSAFQDAYRKLKNKTMLDLANFKRLQLDIKIAYLIYDKTKLI